MQNIVSDYQGLRARLDNMQEIYDQERHLYWIRTEIMLGAVCASTPTPHPSTVYQQRVIWRGEEASGKISLLGKFVESLIWSSNMF